MRKLWAVLLILASCASPALADNLGSAAGGQAASQSGLSGCIYNSAPPTLTSGQQVAVQCDQNGNLKSAGGSSGSPYAVTGTGTAGTPDARVLTVQGISGGLPLIVTDPAVEANTAAAIPAGTNIIGKVGIDQTTPGMTNGVQVADAKAIYGTCTGSSCTVLIAPFDTTGYNTLDLTLTSAGSGVQAHVYGSNDPGVCSSATNWNGPLTFVPFNGLSTNVTYTNINFTNSFRPVPGSFFRCMEILLENGTVSGTFTMEGYLRSINETANVSVVGTVPTVSPPTPEGAAQITASATGTTGAVTASLAGASGKSTWLCGFTITSSGTTTPALVAVTVTGTTTGTLTYEYWPPTTGQGILQDHFSPCVESSGNNIAIAVNVPALGTGTSAVAVNARGFQF